MTEPKRFMVADMAAFAVGPHSFEGEARERLKLSVLDTLGCAIGALGAEPVQAVRRVVEAFGGAGTCTVIGGPRSAPDRAAIREHLSGNYCRCTGYQAIVDAVEAVARARAG